MTGMGEDGAEGFGAIKNCGGLTIAQAEGSCVVYGMPRIAVERGHAMRVVALEALANALHAQCAKTGHRSVARRDGGRRDHFPEIAPEEVNHRQFVPIVRSKDKRPDAIPGRGRLHLRAKTWRGGVKHSAAT